MIKKLLFLFLITGLSSGVCQAQSFVNTADLFDRTDDSYSEGNLSIFQNSSIDSLISRYILLNLNLSKQNNNHYGMDGFRIQIYSSSNRNARDESNKVRADFISKFPDVVSYLVYANPGYYKIRVGDFRTKMEATKLFLMISKEFPDAYIVPDFINFPDQNTK